MPRPKKVIRFTLKSFKNRGGSTSWRVTGTKADGTRVRQNFPTKAEGLQALSDFELEEAGTPEMRPAIRTSLSSEQIADAEAAIRHLNGSSLSQVAAHYHTLVERAAARKVSIDAAMSFFEAHYRPQTKAISIMNAREEFMASRLAIQESTRSNYKGTLQLLIKQDPNKPIHSFQVGDIEGLLARFKAIGSRRTHRRIFSIFFNWCVRHHYCLENPCSRLDRLPRESSKIATLTLEEVKRLLSLALHYQDGVTASAVAIALFAGLRPSEIRDLKKEDISDNRIRVAGGKLRRTLKRSVPIPPVLASWLSAFPFRGLPRGWAYKQKVLKKSTRARHWVADILRHTSLSFQAERDKNEALTAFNCGTSKVMMDRHYRNSVEEDAVAQFWALTPEAIDADTSATKILPKRRENRWPTKGDLKKLVWSRPLVRAAEEIGVSDVALRNRCLATNIDLPKRGYWNRSKPVDTNSFKTSSYLPHPAEPS